MFRGSERGERGATVGPVTVTVITAIRHHVRCPVPKRFDVGPFRCLFLSVSQAAVSDASTFDHNGTHIVIDTLLSAPCVSVCTVCTSAAARSPF